MISTPTSLLVPLRTDTHGVIRIGTSRVTLDSIVYAFQRGATPETIAEKFPSLALAEVYSVIAYYLQNQADTNAYLEQQDAAAESLRERVERDFPAEGMRARLLARREAKRQP